MSRHLWLIASLSVLLCACGAKVDKSGDVITQRYVHKYGYPVSKEEWESRHYPGQVISHLRSGVTVTATYEEGMLHGPCTYTFPNSQVVEVYHLYHQGRLIKEIHYDTKALPLWEKGYLSATRYSLTHWYAEGTPMSIEEYAGEELAQGEYFTPQNDVEARIEKGKGTRIKRAREGMLLSIEEYEKGYASERRTFHANGAPESVATLSRGKLDGVCKTFAASGEPVSIEGWVNGKRHGKATYFKNGAKTYEISYVHGQKNGVEAHFNENGVVAQEIRWENDKRHGPSVYFVGSAPHMEFYYEGKLVSKKEYDEQMRLDEMISQIDPELRVQS